MPYACTKISKKKHTKVLKNPQGKKTKIFTEYLVHMPIVKKYCQLIWEIESHLNQYQGMWDGNPRWENKKISASLPSFLGMLADKQTAAFPYTMRSQRHPASRLCSLPSLWKAIWQCRENFKCSWCFSIIHINKAAVLVVNKLYTELQCNL